jgi:hypothetical protein
MLFILCPYCHARIDIDAAEAASQKARLSADCTECGEAFFFEAHEMPEERRPETAA